MTVIGLNGQPVAVIYLHTVADLQQGQQLRLVHGSKGHIAVFGSRDLQLLPLAFARKHHQLSAQCRHIHFLIYFVGNGLLLDLAAHTGPGSVGTATVSFRQGLHKSQLLCFCLSDNPFYDSLGLYMVALQ